MEGEGPTVKGARGARWTLFALVLVSPGLLPLVCPYLPFQDWPAHVGVVGGLLHLEEPSARVLEFYEYVGWFKMNAAFYLPAYVLAQVLPPLVAVNLTFALSLAALGPATAYFCGAVHAPRTVALLAVPLAVGRHVYCGFAPNAMALALMMLAFGALFRFLGAPRPARGVGLTALLCALAFTHAFIYLAALGLFALVVALQAVRGPRRPAAGAAVALVASLVWFAVLFRQGLGVSGHGEGDGALMAIWTAIQREPHTALLQVFWEWLFASHRYWGVDDLLQWSWLGVLGLGLAGSAWLGRGQWMRGARLELLLLAAVTAFVFWLLPADIGPPVNWWGARLRLPPIVVLLLLPLLGPLFARTRAAAILAGVIAVATVGAFAYDLADFDRRHMAGFSEAVAAIEPGRKVSFLHYTGRRVDEYPGVALGYFGNFAFLEHGGAVPQTFFSRREYPLLAKEAMAAPTWGLATRFRWAQHGVGYDGFLVELHPTTGRPPFDAETLARLEPVVTSGQWAYYRVEVVP